MAIYIVHISMHGAQGAHVIITPAHGAQFHSIKPSQLPGEYTTPAVWYVLRG